MLDEHVVGFREQDAVQVDFGDGVEAVEAEVGVGRGGVGYFERGLVLPVGFVYPGAGALGHPKKGVRDDSGAHEIEVDMAGDLRRNPVHLSRIPRPRNQLPYPPTGIDRRPRCLQSAANLRSELCRADRNEESSESGHPESIVAAAGPNRCVRRLRAGVADLCHPTR